jgi:hypothetical protein
VLRILPSLNWLLITVLVVGVSGCGSDPYGNFAEVSGTLMCNGKPAVGATVIFSPNDDPAVTGREKGNPGPSSKGIVQEDGKFSLITWHYRGEEQTTGALVGPHTVQIEPPMTKRPGLTPGQAGLPPAELAEVNAELDALKLYEPLECATKDVSPASVQVTDDGTNAFDLTLTGEAPKRAPNLRQPGGKMAPPGRGP